MYNLAKTLSDTYSSVSLHAIKSVRKHIRNSSRGHVLKKKSSLPCFPLLSFGRIIDEVVKRCVSHYSIHPEKLKQIIKANESQTLCNFFGSAEYQKRLQAIMENQKRLLSEGSPVGIPESEIKYEHIINCAQPVINSKGEVKNERNLEEEQVITLLETKKKKKPVRTTIMSLILRKKKQEQEEMMASRGHSTIMPLVMQTKMRNQEMKKKFRRKTTILPIFLQKMDHIKEQNETENKKSGEELLNSYYKTKKIASAKFNRKGDFEKTQQLSEDENKESLELRDESTRTGNNFVFNSLFKDAHSVSENLTASPPKYSEESLRDYNPNLSETAKIIIEDGQSKPQDLSHSSRNFENSEGLPEKKKGNKTAFWGSFVKKWKRSSKEKVKKQEVSKSCEMNLPMDAHYEIDPSLVDIIDVSHFRKKSNSPAGEHQALSQKKINDVVENLFDRMKKGSKNTSLQPPEDEKYSKRHISTKFKEQYVSRSPSSTYKTVCDIRETKKQVLKDRFLKEVNFWKKNVFEIPRSIYTKKKKKDGTGQKTVPLALTYLSNSNEDDK